MNRLPSTKGPILRTIARSVQRTDYRLCNGLSAPAHHFHVCGPRPVLAYRLPIGYRSNNLSRGYRAPSAIGLIGLGLGVIIVAAGAGTRTRVLFEPPPSPIVPILSATSTNGQPPCISNIPPGAYDPDQLLPMPRGLANPYELAFGTLCGICAGIFIKKGFKATAFILGGVFVILQCFHSSSWPQIDWTAAENAFRRTFYTTTTDGGSRPPTIQSAIERLLDFVMADFQPRAAFLAGFILGLRLG